MRPNGSRAAASGGNRQGLPGCRRLGNAPASIENGAELGYYVATTRVIPAYLSLQAPKQRRLMQRKILIIDDHDDMATSLEEVFTATGHAVSVLDKREDALAVDGMEQFDVVVTDLDVAPSLAETAGTNGANRHPAPVCLPESIVPTAGEHVKAFKICASNFRRDEFDEDELKNIVATILDYKIRYVDKVD